MNVATVLKSGAIPFVLMMSGLAPPAMAAASRPASLLTGTWTLIAADVIHADGSRGHDYGEHPKGLWIVDAEGRYSLQIYDSDRPRFASGDKAKGTAAEYQGAVLGISAHFGEVTVDPAAHSFTLHIQSASFPNQDNSQQTRFYELKAGELSYRIAPRPNGDVPVSVWRRLP